MPSEMAANVMQSFVGVDLQCAQCHDHPYERWSREEFWNIAAYFQRPSSETNLAIKIPDTDAVVPAPNIFLLSDADLSQASIDRRQLVDWLVHSDQSPFVQRTTDILLAAFFGADFLEASEEASAQLVQAVRSELSWLLVNSNYQLKQPVEVILNSRLYQLSTARAGSFSTLRVLDGAQIFDSLRVAAGQPLDRADLVSTAMLAKRSQFIAQIQPDSRQRFSISQMLEIMNGEATRELVLEPQNLLISSLAMTPFLDERQSIGELFWATLTRPPTDTELELILPLRKQFPTRSAWLQSVFWSVTNSAEFLTNH